MSNISEQISIIEKEIRETPYHKGTEHYIGKLRAKLSKLKDKQFEETTSKKGGGGGYAVKKHGDATVVLVGPPSVGKSTLLNTLTNAQSKMAPYAFTTVTVIPGMMNYKDAAIQILDVPGLIEGAEEGKGRGKEVISVARGANLLVIMTDIEKSERITEIAAALERNGIRINKTPPQVIIEKKVSGGITVHTNIKQTINNEAIKDMARELGIKNGEITIKEKLTLDEIVDAFSRNRIYVPALFVINKSDMLDKEDQEKENLLYISAQEGKNLNKLRELIWEKLGLIRVYLVRREEEPHFNSPIIMKSGQTLNDVAKEIGEEFAEGKTSARIWNHGAKFPSQEVSLNRKIEDGMQIRFI